MFLQLFHKFFGEENVNNFARIDEANNLFGPDGTFVASYSRRRDAIRGAKRRGFVIA